jgi:PAS domain S-box-containing protein
MNEGGKPTVLVVDDNDAGRYAKARVLKRAGFAVMEAADGAEALRLAAAAQPHLMLLDVRLPDISGIEVCRRLKADPATAAILVIQTSATLLEASDRVRGLEGGADTYLTEPMEADELVANVRAMWRLRGAEQSLREREAWLMTTLKSIGDGVIATDAEGRVTLLNPVAETLTGWAEAEAKGRPLAEVFRLVNEETRQPSADPVARVLNEGDVVGLPDHTTLLARDGREWPVDDSAAPITDGAGRVLGVVLIFREIAERRRAEAERERFLRREQSLRAEAETANRLKDEFLSIVSHELRTPLNAMLGWASLLRGGKLPAAQQAQALEVIERNAWAQNQIVSDLLDVSRIITGKLRLDVRPVSLAAVIEAAAAALRPAAEARNISLDLLLPTTENLIEGDADRLQQVVWNLLSNAIKFTPPGGRVAVRLERAAAHASVIVSDTGKGIAPDFLPYVFDRFRQENATTERVHGGLGLGLSIVRHLVELHGGEVRAESAGVGQGATFVVTLPTREAQGQRGAAAGAKPPPLLPLSHSPPSSLSGLRVLVVEDEDDARELIAFILSESGADVRAAGSAAAARAAFDGWRPDVIVSDVGMPGEDGYAFIRQVRALAAERGGQTPAVALTAYARAADRERALAAGFQSHIAKPVEPSELIRIVADLGGRPPGAASGGRPPDQR